MFRMRSVSRLVRIVACSATLLITLPTGALAAERFVSPSGSDSGNTCTSTVAPCRTINAALDQAMAGDVLKLTGGTYLESVLIDTSATLTIEGGYTVDFSNRDTAAFPSVIDGDVTRSGVQLVAGAGIALNITIDGVTVRETTYCGIYAGASGDGTIDLAVRNVVSERNECGLSAWNATVTIENSTFRRNEGIGLHFQEAVVATIDRTRVERNRYGALSAGQASGSIEVRNVIFYANAGVISFGSNLADDSLAVAIENSTVAKSRLRPHAPFAVWGGAVNVFGCGVSLVLRNSIIWGSRGLVDLDVSASPPDCGGAPRISASHSDFESDRWTNGQYTDLGGNLSVNPRLGRGGWLRSISPMIDMGDCAVAPDDDIDGDSRPFGMGCDVGADEFAP